MITFDISENVEFSIKSSQNFYSPARYLVVTLMIASDDSPSKHQRGCYLPL